MLIIISIVNGTETQSNHHIGYPRISELMIRYIIYIQADGDELDEIYDTCPLSLNRESGHAVQRFYGDIAKTIVSNLPMYKQFNHNEI